MTLGCACYQAQPFIVDRLFTSLKGMNMARVRIDTNGEPLLLEQIAKRCKGEFFGSWEKGLLFGFAKASHARLFLKMAMRELKLAGRIIG